MDTFLQGCQGIGLALAAGAIAGAVLGAIRTAGPPLYLLGALAVLGGAILFGASLEAADHPAWPGWIVGGLLALGSFGLTSVVVDAAGRRTERGSGAALAAIVVVAALILAGLSLLIPPISLLALLAALWLSVSRRRVAQRKYEGLRVLR